MQVSADSANSSTSRPNAHRRRRTSLARPGWSMLAQGEPYLWLTGGALALCLCMIGGLLTFIAWRGMKTFWPTPLVQVELRDGGKLLGEMSRSERFQANPAPADSSDSTDGQSSDNADAAADADVDSANGVVPSQRRRLLHTANFDVTQEPFRWVADSQIADATESAPPWAVVIERLENGRFHGFPTEFAVTIARPIGEEEQRLADIVAFFQSAPLQLTDEQRVELESELNDLAPTIAELETRLAELRRSESLAFADSMQGSDFSFTMESGESVPAESVRDAAPESLHIVAAREPHAGPEASWKELQSHRAAVQRRRRQAERIRRNDIGGESERLEAARLKVRGAAMRNGDEIFVAALDLQGLDQQIDALVEVQSEYDRIAESVAAHSSANSPLSKTGKQIAQMLRKRLDEELTPLKEQFAAREAEIAPIPDEVTEFLNASREVRRTIATLQREVDTLTEENGRFELLCETADGQPVAIPLGDIVRAYAPNQLSFGGKLAVYGSRWWEFLTDEPRDANAAGGVFPAIWGTVAMTLIMGMLVAPFGVLAALYLREYSRGGWIVSVIRISINNLAGVPSIVFGVFGLAMFCYTVGAYIDRGPDGAGFTRWPPAIWYIGLFALAVIGTGAFAIGLTSLTATRRTGRRAAWLRYGSLALWLACFALATLLLAKSPFFDGFFQAHAPNPKFGKAGLMWASLTLALLTLPVVIVATEEALAAVPNSLREGSYACGASNWQTIRRIVLPHAMPGIMTGMILAMARGAGEVAPLMLVGAVKIAPDLPVDSTPPFVHLERSFMHLGFHIFDLSFQSQNSEASQPLAFTTTLLLIAIVAALNLSAIAIRSRLKKRFQASQF